MIEDPVIELAIEARQHGPNALTISWSDDPTGEDRNEASVGMDSGPFGQVDWLVYDPALLGVPFQVVRKDSPPEAGPGRKVVGLVVWHHDGDADVVLVSGDRRVGPRRPRRAPASPHELELVAALADRIETGSFLGDLEAAGLVVRISVDRLSAPLGALWLSGGRFEWKEAR